MSRSAAISSYTTSRKIFGAINEQLRRLLRLLRAPCKRPSTPMWE